MLTREILHESCTETESLHMLVASPLIKFHNYQIGF